MAGPSAYFSAYRRMVYRNLTGCFIYGKIMYPKYARRDDALEIPFYLPFLHPLPDGRMRFQKYRIRSGGPSTLFL